MDLYMENPLKIKWYFPELHAIACYKKRWKNNFADCTVILFVGNKDTEKTQK